MENTSTRKLSAADIPALQQLSRQTFTETFAAFNTAENMHNYLEEQFSIDQLTIEFNNKDSEFYFALENDQPIGYLKLNAGQPQTELQNENGLEIERIYVSTAFLGKKVGQLLFDKAMEIARLKKAAYIWLGVWEQNHRAISFYKKQGFVEFGKHIFRLGNDAQTDLMMKLPI
jgi:ribosomal protein S18 acetylase RimI-like enzyme